MDMDIEVEEFKKKNAPSLIGSSIRDSSDAVPTLSSISSTAKTFVKQASPESATPVKDLLDEGSLVAGEEEEEIDDILDNDGHVKKSHVNDGDETELEAEATTKPAVNTSELKTLNAEEDKIDNANKVTILGGDADQYLAPASGNSSGFKYTLKEKQGSDLYEHENTSGTIIEPDKMRSVDDIINVVSKGDSKKASTLIDDDVAQFIVSDKKEPSLDTVKEHQEPVVPDSTIENDSEYTAPAAMREGSDSRLLEEQRSRSQSKYGKSVSQSAYPERPNLARGDSIHSGLHDDLSITNTYDQALHSLISERKPRHDPSSTAAAGALSSKISNHSSLSYLRSISRSRSRMANDRRALGEDHLESKDLRESGALINDDSMSNRSDIEYAVTKALDFVEDTHSVKNGKRLSDSGDIVKNLQKGLAEVAEEEEADKQKALKSSDLLDQLANSAMELMLGSDDEDDNEEVADDEEKEKELDFCSATAKETVVETPENKETPVEEVTEKAEIVAESTPEVKEDTEPENESEAVKKPEEEIPSKVEEESEVETKEKEEIIEPVATREIKSDHKTIEEESFEEITKDEISADLKIEEENKPKTSDIKEPEETEEKAETIELFEAETAQKSTEVEDEISKEVEESNETVEETEKVAETEETEKTAEAKEAENEEEEETEKVKEPVANKETEEEVEEPVAEEETKEEITEVAEPVKKEIEEVTEAVTPVAKEISATVEPVAKAVESVAAPVVAKKDDDIDPIIAAAAREKAMKETFNAPGKDGSVYVPKNAKMTFEDEPVYLYTSFAGGFQVTTRTNRLVTILTANRIKFEYRDLGTDDEAKKVWRRYSQGKTLPGIVRGKDDYIGNWEDIEEANEEYQVRTLIYETY